jgi:dUTP pyrophosphatase
MKLNVKFETTDEDIIAQYKNQPNHTTDSGFDLYVTKTQKFAIGETHFLELGISCEPDGDHGYDLRARSSIYKTPLRLANGVGTIDMSYRGQIKAAVDNIKNYEYTVEKGARLFQLCAPDLKPIFVEFVDKLSDTKRGAGGFGSTNT